MKLFFGKIKPTTDNKQINGTYYETLSKMKLGELKEGDYAFIISGKNIHLWRATTMLEIAGHTRMNFEVILDKIPLNSQKFVAFKYFLLDSSLIVLSIRQSPKAFYPIELADSSFTEEMLLDRHTYEQADNFRKVKILRSAGEIEKNSIDIQIYYDENKHLQIVKAPFFDQSLFDNFIDNLSKEGNGRKFKDNALKKIKKGKEESISYSSKDLSILRVYDALFNEYGNLEEPETAEAENEHSQVEYSNLPSIELKSVNQIYYGPPGTGKTYLVRKNFCLEEEIIYNSQDRKRLDSSRNFWHLAPGRNGYLWDQLKNGNVLGYEWVDKSWGDLESINS